MIYKADRYNAADIKDETSRKIQQLWGVTNAFACSSSIAESPEQDFCAILNMIDLLSEQFEEYAKAVEGVSHCR